MSEKYKSIKILESVYEMIMERRNQYSLVLGRVPTISETIKAIIDKAGDLIAQDIKMYAYQNKEEKQRLMELLIKHCKEIGIPDEIISQLIKDCSRSLEQLDASAIKVLQHILEDIIYAQKIRGGNP
jgi:hypothetical protein